MSGLLADVCEAGVKSEPRVFELFGRIDVRAGQPRSPDTHSDVVERSADNNDSDDGQDS